MSPVPLTAADPGPPPAPGPKPEMSEAEIAEVARELSPEPAKPKPRPMMRLYAEIAAWANETMQFGWDAAAKTEKDPVLVDPKSAAKLITKAQWIEAMRAAAAVFTRPRARTLGAPEAVAHPSGRAGLAWRSGDWSFTVLIDTLSGPTGFRCSFERRDARGAGSGVLADLRDLGEAVEASLCGAARS